MTATTLHLYKQDFKFSAAHFLIFDSLRAERLHGHNYRVFVDVQVPQVKAGGSGYSIDFSVLKKIIRETLQKWDEMVLLPAKNKELKSEKKGPSLHVHFRDRYYVFPHNEVHLLPIENTSVEEMCRLLVETWQAEFARLGVQKIKVRMEETRGQSASYGVSSLTT